MTEPRAPRRLAGLLLLGATVALFGLGAAGAARDRMRHATVSTVASTKAGVKAGRSERSAVSVAGASAAAAAAAGSSVPAEKPAPFVIVAAGDVNLGRECGQAILEDPQYDPFRFMGPIWGDAALRFVNLESQLSDQDGETQSPRNRLIFTGPPGGAETLAQAGVAVVSTANNH